MTHRDWRSLSPGKTINKRQLNLMISNLIRISLCGCNHELSISTTVTNLWFVLTMKYCKVRINIKIRILYPPVAIQSVGCHWKEKQAQQFRYGYARNNGVHR
jgi:hypothetical protein